VIVLEGSDQAHGLARSGQAERVAAAYADATWAAPDDLGPPAPGSLAAWAAARGLPVLVVETPESPPRALLLRAGLAGRGVEAAIDAATVP
jgi:hypothetical protein